MAKVFFTPHVIPDAPEIRRYELHGYHPGLDYALCILIDKLVGLNIVEDDVWFDSRTANLYVPVSYANVWNEGCSPESVVLDWFDNPAALIAALAA